MLIGLASILLLVFATGFFVASEFSIVSVRKTRIEQLISEGRTAAKDVKYAIEHLQQYIAAIQIGVTMASLGVGALGEPVLAGLFVPPLEQVLPEGEALVSAHAIAIAISFLIVNILEIVLGEIVPKVIARQRPEMTVLLTIRPINFFAFIFRPLVWLVTMLSNLVLRILGLPPGANAEQANVHSVEELEMLVVSSRKAGVLDREEEVILRRVFDFGDLTARQVMRPRTEIVAIPVTATLPEVIEIMTKHQHSRFPVYDGDLDNIVGVLHVKDVFMALAEAQVQEAEDGSPDATPDGQENAIRGSQDGSAAGGRHFDVRSLMRPIEAVPETLDVAELLQRMRQSGTHMVVVVDEYGGTAGIVTLEDIVEEIVGEVRDEFESEDGDSDIVQTPEGTLIDGLVSIDDANEVLGLGIESEADTVGGYVFEVLGRKPEVGDEIRSDGHVMRVEELDGLRIARVRVLPQGSVREPDDEE
jgi:putative hemolysin